MSILQANKWLIGNISAGLIASATLWEGTKYYAYYDIVGVPTVCMGYTGSGIVFGRRYTQAECTNYLKTELVIHSTGVLNCIKKPLKENEFSALTLFTYNVGISGACSSRAFSLFNTGNTIAACDALAHSPLGKPVWSYTNNGAVFVNGLYKRRLYEKAMCLGEGNV